MSLRDIAFPYRAKRNFGAASFALVFLMLILEIELLVAIALGVVAHRLDLFRDLQTVVLPGAVLISLATSTVFAWRARSWTKSRIAGLADYGSASAGYAERLAKSRPGS
ncbi:MAG TPA: hypothetical protein VHG53_06250 [Candidatus Limnocylindria bacterium]|nr:hypothetical protein [Candidatus Limnocylindria bacterium]